MNDVGRDFVLNNGGSILKHIILKDELKNTKKLESLTDIQKAVMGEKVIAKWFDALKSKSKLHDCNGIHGATNHHLENSLPMILQLGIGREFPEFEQVMEPIIERVKRKVFPESHVFSRFMDIIIVPFLYEAGYRDGFIMKHVKERLDVIYNFTKRKSYDIYENREEFKGIPKSFKDRRIIKKELCKDGMFSFPLIYDMFLLASVSQRENDEELQRKVETIVEYTLDDEYQKLDQGYGILVSGRNRYLAMGWDAKLPEVNNKKITSLVIQRLMLLSNFKCGRAHEWFTRKIDILEHYKTERGTYILPKEFLLEKEACWVKGNHMSYGENRRKKISIELESTYVMMKIKR